MVKLLNSTLASALWTRLYSGCSSSSVPNGPGARQGPEDGLPRARDRTGRQKICRPRPQNIKTAVFRKDDGPDNLKHKYAGCA